MVERQKEIALVVILNDDLMFYRHDRAMERFTGLRPPLYDKMKTVAHMPLGVYCLLHEQTGRPLGEARLAQLADYRDAIKAAAPVLESTEQAKAGFLPGPSPVFGKVTGFLDAVFADKTVSHEALAAFAASAGPHIGPLLAAAAHAQLDACHAIMRQIRQTRLTEEEWASLRVLVLGPFMARR